MYIQPDLAFFCMWLGRIYSSIFYIYIIIYNIYENVKDNFQSLGSIGCKYFITLRCVSTTHAPDPKPHLRELHRRSNRAQPCATWLLCREVGGGGGWCTLESRLFGSVSPEVLYTSVKAMGFAHCCRSSYRNPDRVAYRDAT